MALCFGLVVFVLTVGVLDLAQQPQHDVLRRTIARHGLRDQAREAVPDPDWQFPPARSKHEEHRHGIRRELAATRQGMDPPIADDHPRVANPAAWLPSRTSFAATNGSRKERNQSRQASGSCIGRPGYWPSAYRPWDGRRSLLSSDAMSTAGMSAAL